MRSTDAVLYRQTIDMNTSDTEDNIGQYFCRKRMDQRFQNGIAKTCHHINESHEVIVGAKVKHGTTRTSEEDKVVTNHDTMFEIDDGTEFETNDDDDYDVTDYEKLKGMVKEHYIDKSQRKQCLGCGKKFSLTRRQRHCRRCGEVFCISCVKTKLKLNRLARPDPNGKQRKVCKTCYHEDSLELGCVRSLTSEFETERKFAKYSRIVNSRVNSLTPTFFPDQIDRRQECVRLMRGFKDSVDRLGTSKTVQEVRVLMKTPSWQKSRYWQVEIQATKCRSCHVDKGVRKSSGNCRICGLALCKKCTHKELLLYIHEKDCTRDARLAIINAKGCPSIEPSVSLLLYTCQTCKDYVIEQQGHDPLWFTDRPRSLQDELVKFNEKLSPVCEQINSLRRKIEDILDESDVDDLSTKHKHLIKTYIAKLKDQLNEFDCKFKTLKSFAAQTESNSQRVFLKNYTKGKYDFFMENKWKCRTLLTKIENCQNTFKHSNI